MSGLRGLLGINQEEIDPNELLKAALGAFQPEQQQAAPTAPIQQTAPTPQPVGFSDVTARLGGFAGRQIGGEKGSNLGSILGGAAGNILSDIAQTRATAPVIPSGVGLTFGEQSQLAGQQIQREETQAQERIAQENIAAQERLQRTQFVQEESTRVKEIQSEVNLQKSKQKAEEDLKELGFTRDVALGILKGDISVDQAGAIGRRERLEEAEITSKEELGAQREATTAGRIARTETEETTRSLKVEDILSQIEARDVSTARTQQRIDLEVNTRELKDKLLVAQEDAERASAEKARRGERPRFVKVTSINENGEEVTEFMTQEDAVKLGPKVTKTNVNLKTYINGLFVELAELDAEVPINKDTMLGMFATGNTRAAILDKRKGIIKNLENAGVDVSGLLPPDISKIPTLTSDLDIKEGEIKTVMNKKGQRIKVTKENGIIVGVR